MKMQQKTDEILELHVQFPGKNRKIRIFTGKSTDWDNCKARKARIFFQELIKNLQ